MGQEVLGVDHLIQGRLAAAALDLVEQADGLAPLGLTIQRQLPELLVSAGDVVRLAPEAVQVELDGVAVIADLGDLVGPFEERLARGALGRYRLRPSGSSIRLDTGWILCPRPLGRCRLALRRHRRPQRLILPHRPGPWQRLPRRPVRRRLVGCWFAYRPTMPANLTPDYERAEERLRQAADDAERLEALREMLSTIPKHKGTEKMQADIKRRISQLTKAAAKKTHVKGVDPFHIPRGGAGQIVLVGPPNVGKSQLLATTTHAAVKVADYPFTTALPAPGMWNYQDVQMELVDTPPVTAGHVPPGLLGTIRAADIIAVVVDAADEPAGTGRDGPGPAGRARPGAGLGSAGGAGRPIPAATAAWWSPTRWTWPTAPPSPP